MDGASQLRTLCNSRVSTHVPMYDPKSNMWSQFLAAQTIGNFYEKTNDEQGPLL